MIGFNLWNTITPLGEDNQHIYNTTAIANIREERAANFRIQLTSFSALSVYDPTQCLTEMRIGATIDLASDSIGCRKGPPRNDSGNGHEIDYSGVGW
jgi:hypothetical protein